MPVSINTAALKYRDQQGTYQSINSIKGDNGALNIVAPAYENLTYPVAAGQGCIYNDLYYVAKQDITSQESWTAGHWEQKMVDEELSTLLNALSKSSENTNIAISAHPVGDLFWYNGTLHVATSAIAVGDTIIDSGIGANCKDTTISEALIKDIQINGTSILQNGVANIPIATNTGLGLVRVGGYGLTIASSGIVRVSAATSAQIKNGSNTASPITPLTQHESAFYAIATASGDTTQASSSNPVGQYTESAKSSISQMLNGAVQVTGTTPVITAKSGIRYICGECATLDITAPESGIIDVVFESGSTPTVLTVTPPTGMTMKWIGDDPTVLEANKTYEINIKDGCLGMVVSWT